MNENQNKGKHPICEKCGGVYGTRKELVTGTVMKDGKRFSAVICPRCILSNKKEVKRMPEMKNIKVEDIPLVARARTSVGAALLQQFYDSKNTAVVITPEKDESGRSIAWSLNRAIRKAKATNVAMSFRDGKIYLQYVKPTKTGKGE
jgi:hypothetical protein